MLTYVVCGMHISLDGCEGAGTGRERKRLSLRSIRSLTSGRPLPSLFSVVLFFLLFIRWRCSIWFLFVLTSSTGRLRLMLSVFPLFVSPPSSTHIPSVFHVCLPSVTFGLSIRSHRPHIISPAAIAIVDSDSFFISFSRFVLFVYPLLCSLRLHLVTIHRDITKYPHTKLHVYLWPLLFPVLPSFMLPAPFSPSNQHHHRPHRIIVSSSSTRSDCV